MSKPTKSNEKPKKKPPGKKPNERPQTGAGLKEAKDQKQSAPQNRKPSNPKPAKAEVVIVPQVRSKYSKRKIDIVTRLDLPEDIYDAVEESSRGADLHKLFNRPATFGDHFQFKSEKVHDDESKHPNDNTLFTLDFRKIGEHIRCTPFYEAAGLDLDLFSEDQISSMKREAEVYRAGHRPTLPSSQIPEPCKKTEELLKNLIIEDSRERHIVEAKKSEETCPKIDVDLDDLLETVKCDVPSLRTEETVPESSVKIAPVQNSQPQKPTEDLEKWLDDFLDD